MHDRSEMRAGLEWAQRTLGRTPYAETPEARKAAIREEVEAEVAGWDAERKAKAEREEGQRMAETALRHAHAVERPRDTRPQEPVGTERRAHDGTVWVRKA
ncbi:hypothetical protein [Methylobacterium segetis]|uniref:hypothetical protein n=1 Tax=Methylobacterium segetis TaxID=2488750 RepID=UPI00104CB8A5|nr:hypothetical protein [Methylobacterium segetis]